jgi:hypothetical protein
VAPRKPPKCDCRWSPGRAACVVKGGGIGDLVALDEAIPPADRDTGFVPEARVGDVDLWLARTQRSPIGELQRPARIGTLKRASLTVFRAARVSPLSIATGRRAADRLWRRRRKPAPSPAPGGTP